MLFRGDSEFESHILKETNQLISNIFLLLYFRKIKRNKKTTRIKKNEYEMKRKQWLNVAINFSMPTMTLCVNIKKNQREKYCHGRTQTG